MKFCSVIALSVFILMEIMGCYGQKNSKNNALALPYIDENLVRRSIGKTDSNGRLIFFTHGERNIPVSLKGDYGMMVFSHVPTHPNLVQYELYFQNGLRIYRTRDIETFEKLLYEVPKGAKIDWYNTCCGGTYSGLNDNIVEDLINRCKKRSIILKRDEVICTCEDWYLEND